ncbi:MAG: putative nucleotidyltransferase with HDIG domain [Bradymonadia bacterium]
MSVVDTSSRRAQIAQKIRRRDLSNPLLRAIVGVAFVALLALIIAPQSAETPRLSEGRIGAVANRDIVASHDFAFEPEDPAGLAAVREEAGAEVLPVWDHDANLGARIDTKIHDAFVTAREMLAEAAETRRDAAQAAEGARLADELASESAVAVLDDTEVQDGTSRGSDGGVAADEGGPTRDAALRPSALPTREAANSPARAPASVQEWVPAERRVSLLQQEPMVMEMFTSMRNGDEALRKFAAAGFTVPTEDALRALIRAAMEEIIVEDVRALDSVESDGIVLRTIDLAGTSETQVRRFSRFHDLSDVEALISQAQHHLRYVEERAHQLAIEDVARSTIVLNTRFNGLETNSRRQAAMAAVEAAFRERLTETYKSGELLVPSGHVITADHVARVGAMYQTAPPKASRVQTFFGTFVLLILSLFPILVFALSNLRSFSHQTRDLMMMGFVLLLHLGLTNAGIFIADLVAENRDFLPALAWRAVLPFAAGSMLVRILTNAEDALIYGVIYALLTGMLLDFDASYTAMALIASVVASGAVGRAQTRTDILTAGAVVGAVMLGLNLALSLVMGTAEGTDLIWFALAASLCGLTSALLVYGLLPVVETLFRYTTPLKLMELANLNHPALRELILKAPGSYHHSMMVGQLVEAACEAVGADALLGRVGAYFHDIGKAKNPRYFAENQDHHNPHDKLKPNMSALIIKAHVKDGVELARQHKLPEEIIDFIREHHGTSLIQYFYRRAQEETDGEVREEDYRYPGPRPRSRETAICLLADGIEAASRALPDPNHAHLKGLVQRMVNRAFTDGQLDDCDLTLRDLHVIAQAFLLRLTAFYHQRPEYPDAAKRPTSRNAPIPGPPPVEDSNDRDDDPPTDGGPDEPPADSADESGVHLRRLGM